MAIGGYKFRGYHYPARTATAGSEAEKAIFLDWFKCRLAAFKASCEASGALWHVLDDYLDGGNWASDAWGNRDCIWELDDTGCNFGTFFQYGNEEKYMAMVCRNAVSASISWRSGVWAMYNDGSSLKYDDGSDLIALDSAPITPDNWRSKPVGRLPLRSSDYAPSAATFSSRGVSALTNGISYGFATKDSDIEEFCHYQNPANVSTANDIYYCCYSYEAFQSLSSPSDTYGLSAFGYKINGYSASNESSLVTATHYNVIFEMLTNDGTEYHGASTGSNYAQNSVYVPLNCMARYSSTMAVVPFSAISVVSNTIPISTEHIYSKGSVKIDLVATNTDMSRVQNVSTTLGSVQGGGNYLCVYVLYIYGVASNWQAAVYIGWDPSNPSILASTSWPDWPDAMPEAPTAQTAPVDPVNVQ